jgi:hypothetical protein
MSFMPDVSAAVVDPVTFYPVGAAVGGMLVVAGDPDVSVAVPAVVSGLPDQTLMGRRRCNLHGARRWRSDADDDLGVRGRDCQRCGEYQTSDCCECWLLHSAYLLQEALPRMYIDSDVRVRHKVVVKIAEI